MNQEVSHVEIARKEMPRATVSISASLNPDGKIRVEGVDVGEAVQEWWKDDDYEYWVEVPASEVGRLALTLLKEKYDGSTNAVSEFKTFCEKQGIAHQFWTWR
jgi:hypothetical protein